MRPSGIFLVASFLALILNACAFTAKPDPAMQVLTLPPPGPILEEADDLSSLGTTEGSTGSIPVAEALPDEAVEPISGDDPSSTQDSLSSAYIIEEIEEPALPSPTPEMICSFSRHKSGIDSRCGSPDPAAIFPL